MFLYTVHLWKCRTSLLWGVNSVFGSLDFVLFDMISTTLIFPVNWKLEARSEQFFWFQIFPPTLLGGHQKYFMGLERWFSHWEQVLLPQRTQICFPAPTRRDLQLLLNSSRWTRHLWPLSKHRHRHKHRCTCTQIHTIKNEINPFY